MNYDSTKNIGHCWLQWLVSFRKVHHRNSAARPSLCYQDTASFAASAAAARISWHHKNDVEELMLQTKSGRIIICDYVL